MFQSVLKASLLFALAAASASSWAFDSAKVERVSERFLGAPYVEDPLGEGERGEFDTDPLVRFDAFDCTTFVETVLALTHARNEAEFQKTLLKLRYRRGTPKFEERNHFPGLDWITNNVRNGLLVDATEELFGAEGLTHQAEAVIEKREWYAYLESSRINNQTLRASDEKLFLAHAKLRALGMSVKPAVERVRYLSKEAIIDRPELLERIPSGAVLNIVRPNWNVKDQVGTNYNISHQGLVIRKDGILFLRHASTKTMHVTDVPLFDYIDRTMRSPSIGGINIVHLR